MVKERLTLESHVAVSDDVVSRELEAEAVILNLESGTYFGLDPVGSRIWFLVQENGSLRRTFEVLHQEFDVAPERLERDILRLVDQLRATGLLRVAPSKESLPTRA
jgi:hypothetical protein